MAKNKFKKPDGPKGEGEKTGAGEKGDGPVKAPQGPPGQGEKAKTKGQEKAARRYGKKEVRKGD